MLKIIAGLRIRSSASCPFVAGARLQSVTALATAARNRTACSQIRENLESWELPRGAIQACLAIGLRPPQAPNSKASPHWLQRLETAPPVAKFVRIWKAGSVAVAQPRRAWRSDCGHPLGRGSKASPLWLQRLDTAPPVAKSVRIWKAAARSLGASGRDGFVQVKPVCVHDLCPGGDEITDELLLVIVLGVNLGVGPENRV